MKKVVVVGGGAGGLELVTRLAKSFRRNKQGEVLLVDKSATHVWKPLLHEVAAGVIDKLTDGVEYRVHASRHNYEFQQGELIHIDKDKQVIQLEELRDAEGELILPKREIAYDVLVLAVGSVSNDFNTPGVVEHAYFLDSLKQAERFHRALLTQFLRFNQDSEQRTLEVAIVGGGATGIELAAELHHVANLSRIYGMPKMSADRIHISIIEAGPRILPALSDRIAGSAKRALKKLGVTIYESTRVVEAKADGFVNSEGELITADLMVWAAGIKAPPLIGKLGIFETNRASQVLVNEFLQSTVSSNLYVLGDCCGVQREDGSWVPPRAQSAHQMAAVVAKNILASIQGKEPVSFKYRDHGSLVNMSKYSTVGSLMGNLTNGVLFIEGWVARMVYTSLYAMHQFAVHGWFKALLVMLSRKVGNLIGPKLKLH